MECIKLTLTMIAMFVVFAFGMESSVGHTKENVKLSTSNYWNNVK